jgi:hypothetical protein
MDFLFETYNFSKDFLKKEIKNLNIGIKNTFLKDNLFYFEVSIIDEIEKKLNFFYYYSKYIKKIYTLDKKYERFSLNVFNVDDKFYYDIFNIDLNENNLINKANSQFDSSIFYNFLYEKYFKKSILNINKSKILDFNFDFAMGSIQFFSFFLNYPRIDLFRKRYEIPLFKVDKINLRLNFNEKFKINLKSNVLDNLSFKKSKENLNFKQIKFLISKIDLDFLDLKYDENDLDFGFMFFFNLDNYFDYINFDKEEFLDKLFYQLDYILRYKFFVISDENLNDFISNYNNLTFSKTSLKEEFDKNLYLYIISKK